MGNLQLVTHQENCKKSAINRDYTFAAKIIKKKVKAINCETNEETYFNSMYAAQQHLNINAGVIKMICDKNNNCKTGISKNDQQKYRFKYVKKADMPMITKQQQIRDPSD